MSEKKVQETVREHSKKVKKYFLAGLLLIILAASIAVLICYNNMAVYYQTHFFPHTIINGIDCGEMESDAVIALFDSRMDNYVLEVTGRDYKSGESGSILGTIVPEDICLVFDGTAEAVTSILEHQEESKWIRAYFGQSESHSFERSITFDEEMLSDEVASWEACQKENMREAEDAYISDYSEVNNCYEIVNETIGTELDIDQVIHLVCDAVGRGETALDVEAEGCYVQASIMRDDRTLTHIVDTVNRWLGTCIIYDWNGTEVKLDHEILKDWISLSRNEPVLDENAAAEFVRKQAAEYDTYGRRRNFITALGVELTLPSGYYGWRTDTKSETEELIQLIYQGSVTEREPIYSNVAKKKGMSDIGNSYVEADLTHQHLYLYQNGSIVLETDFVSGSMTSTPDCMTPAGVFGISYKTRNAVLRGANYRTPVNYWMPFYGNYGMHDAVWRSEFGGDIYISNGSHGCLNLPLDMAEQIYKNVSEGFPVICYYYQEDPLAGQGESDESVPEPDSGWEDDDTDDWDGENSSDLEGGNADEANDETDTGSEGGAETGENTDIGGADVGDSGDGAGNGGDDADDTGDSGSGIGNGGDDIEDSGSGIGNGGDDIKDSGSGIGNDGDDIKDSGSGIGNGEDDTGDSAGNGGGNIDAGGGTGTGEGSAGSGNDIGGGDDEASAALREAVDGGGTNNGDTGISEGGPGGNGDTGISEDSIGLGNEIKISGGKVTNVSDREGSGIGSGTVKGIGDSKRFQVKEGRNIICIEQKSRR